MHFLECLWSVTEVVCCYITFLSGTEPIQKACYLQALYFLARSIYNISFHSYNNHSSAAPFYRTSLPFLHLRTNLNRQCEKGLSRRQTFSRCTSLFQAGHPPSAFPSPIKVNFTTASLPQLFPSFLHIPESYHQNAETQNRFKYGGIY